MPNNQSQPYYAKGKTGFDLNWNKREPAPVHPHTEYNFHGYRLISLYKGDTTYIVMPPVAKILNLNWKKLGCLMRKDRNWKTKVFRLNLYGNRIQKFTCIPFKQFLRFVNQFDPAIAACEEQAEFIRIFKDGMVEPLEFKPMLTTNRISYLLGEPVEELVAKDETAYTPKAIRFHGQQLIGAEVDGTVYVAMKPIVMGMGITWFSQYRKLVESKRYNHMIIPIQTSVNIQKMLCIPLTKLNGWLFSINPDKVAPAIRDQVILYQQECFIVLYNYFEKGAAINQRHIPSNTLPELRQASGDLLNLSTLLTDSLDDDGYRHLIYEANQMAAKAQRTLHAKDAISKPAYPDFTSVLTMLGQNGIKFNNPEQYQRLYERYSMCSAAIPSLVALITLHMTVSDQITRSSEPIKN